MAPVAGIASLHVAAFFIMIVLSKAFVISGHPGFGHKEDNAHVTLPSQSQSEPIDIKLNTSPSFNYKQSEKEYVKLGRGRRAFSPARRFLEAEGFTFRPGSTPPNCEGKCQGCTPCDLQPIVIPHMVSVSSVDYKYEHWACVCKKVTYLASTRT
ncbi:hypothetical protein AXG93_4360s1140 [Marchantia polymorpha subsp. ruderalis]|uniref:Epidermal patterning factor-like protein n=2 Tax=Marchantia polymorpha TaxID=3197 RepID=A0A176W2S2_MARPO|nr:hypothetical protein AXG93_4360s1140 [Marchantia polymorpha subsp. ruderalis]